MSPREESEKTMLSGSAQGGKQSGEYGLESKVSSLEMSWVSNYRVPQSEWAAGFEYWAMVGHAQWTLANAKILAITVSPAIKELC